MRRVRTRHRLGVNSRPNCASVSYRTSLDHPSSARGVAAAHAARRAAQDEDGTSNITQAQRLLILAERVIQSPHQHLTRQNAARALKDLSLETVLVEARWPIMARQLWINVQQLAGSSDAEERDALAALIRITTEQRWRQSQSPRPPARPTLSERIAP